MQDKKMFAQEILKTIDEMYSKYDGNAMHNKHHLCIAIGALERSVLESEYNGITGYRGIPFVYVDGMYSCIGVVAAQQYKS